MIRITTSMYFVVGNTDECKQRVALNADLQRMADGWMPGVGRLAACPLIEQWSTVFYPGTTELAMQGTVTGYPNLPDGRIVTSPICAMDFRERWVRTHNRFYRLGERMRDE